MITLRMDTVLAQYFGLSLYECVGIRKKGQHTKNNLLKKFGSLEKDFFLASRFPDFR